MAGSKEKAKKKPGPAKAAGPAKGAAPVPAAGRENPLLTAINLQQQGKLPEAEALFRHIIQVAPGNPAAL
ncbi:hypothetical protein RHDC4_00524 [Rhodocyclaceae bacterium]|nr:hypothetical protein RHDC4_00524 [Rhodocyclaceae bacterium]